MSQLSQNYWENIQQVNLCNILKYKENNQLFNEGIKYLVRCYWPKLIYLNLCKYVIKNSKLFNWGKWSNNFNKIKLAIIENFEIRFKFC